MIRPSKTCKFTLSDLELSPGELRVRSTGRVYKLAHSSGFENRLSKLLGFQANNELLGLKQLMGPHWALEGGRPVLLPASEARLAVYLTVLKDLLQ